MMTQRVMTKGVDLFSSSKLSRPAKDKMSSTKSSFSSVMDDSMHSDKGTVKQSNIKSKKVEKVEKLDKVEKPENVDAKTIEPVKVKETESKVGDLNDIKSVQEKIKKTEDVIQSTVQSSLGLSEEELGKIMETLGFSMLDLLNVDNMKQLVLQANGAGDITAVLTDENLANSIQNLIQAVDDLKLGEIVQVSQEELAMLMNNGNVEETTDSETSIKKETTILNTIIPSDNLSNKDTQNIDSSKSIDNQKEIILEIHKTTDTSLESNTSDTNSSNENEAEIELPTQVNLFVENLAVTGNNNSQSFTQQIANVRQMQEITNQIIEQIKVFIKPDQTSMELQLNPENLGKINLSVIARDGVLTAQFTTQNEIAKEAIESQMQVLRDNLTNQGLKVDSIEVTVSNFAFEQSNQAATGEEQQNNSQRRNMIRDEGEMIKNLTEEEALVVNMMEQNGNSIDYTA